MKISERIFGTLNGKNVKSYTIENANGMEMTCIDYGCIITKINVPDQFGKIENVVLGFDSLQEYIDHSPYFGCVIGRNSGRMKKAQFEMDGNTYHLFKNDGKNNLHGGPNGLHHVIWNSMLQKHDHHIDIIFSYTSPDGEEGFPGNLQVEVTYSLNDQNELLISYKAISDKKTVVNLTNHSYFNLSGHLKRNILNHELTLKSDRFLELDDELLPTGNVLEVDGTGFDFREGKKIGCGIKSDHPQIKIVGSGFDHPFLLNNDKQPQICLSDKESGRRLQIKTDEPAVVFYTGNMLTGDFFIRGTKSEKYLGLCLETQKPPSNTNQPTALFLEKNQVYSSRTMYIFH